jgi:hypothetical protein
VIEVHSITIDDLLKENAAGSIDFLSIDQINWYFAPVQQD